MLTRATVLCFFSVLWRNDLLGLRLSSLQTATSMTSVEQHTQRISMLIWTAEHINSHRMAFYGWQQHSDNNCPRPQQRHRQPQCHLAHHCPGGQGDQLVDLRYWAACHRTSYLHPEESVQRFVFTLLFTHKLSNMLYTPIIEHITKIHDDKTMHKNK